MLPAGGGGCRVLAPRAAVICSLSVRYVSCGTSVDWEGHTVNGQTRTVTLTKLYLQNIIMVRTLVFCYRQYMYREVASPFTSDVPFVRSPCFTITAQVEDFCCNNDLMERGIPLGQPPLPAGKQDDLRNLKYIFVTSTSASTCTSSNILIHTTGRGDGDEVFRWVVTVFGYYEMFVSIQFFITVVSA